MTCAAEPACVFPVALPHPWKPGAMCCAYHAEMLSAREKEAEAYENAKVATVSPQLARQMEIEAARERNGKRGPDLKPRAQRDRFWDRQRKREAIRDRAAERYWERKQGLP